MAITVTLAQTKMKDGSTKLQLKTPYTPDLPAKCRAIGGKWGSGDKAWYFDTRDADRVRALCVQAFGIDPLAEPDEQPELVTVRLNMDAFNTRAAELWLFGREIVSQPSRDGRTRLGENVVIVSGGFLGGGSRANPAMNAKDGTVLEVRDVPRQLAEEQIKKWAAYGEQQAKIVAERVEKYGADYNDGGITATYRQQVEAAKSAVVIVEEAPQPERVDPATAQIGALFSTLAPTARRAVIMSMIANFPREERPALVKEIQQYLEQGAF